MITGLKRAVVEASSDGMSIEDLDQSVIQPAAVSDEHKAALAARVVNSHRTTPHERKRSLSLTRRAAALDDEEQSPSRLLLSMESDSAEVAAGADVGPTSLPKLGRWHTSSALDRRTSDVRWMSRMREDVGEQNTMWKRRRSQ